MAARRKSYPLNASQQRTWLNYMRVYHRLEYEMNRQLLADCGLSLSDYTVLNALSQAPGRRTQLTALATTIGWERSRLSHHLQRMNGRGLVERVRSDTDRRSTDVLLSDAGWDTLRSAAPLHAEWVRTLFFSDLDDRQDEQLADILAVVYDSILREGTLPRPDQT
ncbi:MarR family winged helix-turn-helix transcriptional regulator [Mycolicibacterium aichiense]|uniref:MarR family transcriptional regulator n=1 Tax=Mycolicibacterium aichiense TaxID=1799 RepID=A0AAD1HQ64_9MYCO|nr:MarR family winged helix-turn-helix transcriptional regulator [Mycolicibacterium aichiense]BBX09688.1 MarR family transcriptional regulator [Mycolicibacterium aichiense]SUA14252.1 transcriptional regulator [Mycolicibacterium aichiense]